MIFAGPGLKYQFVKSSYVYFLNAQHPYHQIVCEGDSYTILFASVGMPHVWLYHSYVLCVYVLYVGEGTCYSRAGWVSIYPRSHVFRAGGKINQR